MTEPFRPGRHSSSVAISQLDRQPGAGATPDGGPVERLADARTRSVAAGAGGSGMDETTTLSVTLPSTLRERFAAAAAATGVDEEALLVELVRDHVAPVAAVAARPTPDGTRGRDGPRTDGPPASDSDLGPRELAPVGDGPVRRDRTRTGPDRTRIAPTAGAPPSTPR
jgi:hypothetical protein